MAVKREEKIEKNINLAEVFYGLADCNRIRILNALTLKAETNATKLVRDVKCKQATLSHHLKLLTDLEIINVRKEGKNTFYHINQKKLDELSDYIQQVAGDFGFTWYKNNREEYWKKVDKGEWVPHYF